MAPPALAGKDNDTLVWTSDSEPANLDWYQHTLREGIVLGHHIWDGLLYKNLETGELEPHLAESVEWVDDTTIDVVLKEGITFHNGEALTADDVVYTVNWVSDPDNSVVARNRIFYLESAEKTGEYTARIHLNDPFPPAMEYIANGLMIYPNEYYEEVGPDGMANEPVGTGPYRVTEVSPGNQIVLEAYDEYFGGAKGQPSIGNLVFRRIGELNTQLIELMTGGVDWIWRVPPDAARQLEGEEALTVQSGETMRIGFLNMDSSGNSGDHPLTDVNVRRAINHAIDRDAIREQMMGGNSSVIDVACAPMQFGCIDDSATTYEHDPERARELLAEAGYEDGLTIEFYTYRDRPIAEAIMGDLREVGIQVDFEFVQSSALQEMRRNDEVQMAYQAWGSSSIADMTASTGNFFRGNQEDFHLDEQVFDLFEQGRTTDQAAREEAYEELLARISEQAYIVPLFTYSMFFAHTNELNFTPSPDEIARFYRASWKEE